MTTARSPLRWALLAASVACTALASDTSDFCSSVTSCLEDGSTECDTTTGDCPPCIYVLDDSYTCWEKDNSTNTCPFTGVRYDCSDDWASSSSTSTSTGSTSLSAASLASASTSSSSSSSGSVSSADTTSSEAAAGIDSSLITYGAIGLGALLVIVLLLILCLRRRKMKRRRQEAAADAAAGAAGRSRALSDKRARGMSNKFDSALTGPYNNILDSSKSGFQTAGNMNPYGYSRDPRKQSDPVMMEAPRRDSDGHSFVSRVPTDSSVSYDGMLADSTHSPAMLGGGSSQHSSGHGSAAPVVGGIGGFSGMNELVQQDVATRCTTSGNVYGEYLRMKEEMKFDDSRVDRSTAGGISIADSDFSDLDSETMSVTELGAGPGLGRLPPPRPPHDLDDGRSSMADSIADSVTDSEYAEMARNRGESDCYSEMSYNDEKYSFSESFDGASLDDSQVRGARGAAPHREVEI